MSFAAGSAATHELGHIVFGALPGDHKVAWESALDRDHAILERIVEGYPTLSGPRLRAEAFATCYADYVTLPREFPCRDVYYFMYDHIFEETEYR